MSIQSVQLAFSALYHYLDESVKKALSDLPIQLVDILNYLAEAEELALGTTATKQADTKLLSILEGINRSNNPKQYCYDFKPLSPDNIFPLQKNEENRPLAELWNGFIQAVKDIPSSHKANADLWLDHFDTALQCFTSQIACPYDNTISLYDFSKAVAAFVVALSKKENEEQPFLLIQGDFFGIQDFIFSGGSQSNKGAAKLLRGRSFQVSLFTELAALKVLNACGLPATSQMMNAAGKFLIIAPNTAKIREKLDEVQKELNTWFIEQTYGLIGLGIATQTAKADSFRQEHYESLVKSLFEALEVQKLQRLDLTDSTVSVQEVSYPFGVCEMSSFFPAKENGRSMMSQDQIKIGELLAEKKRLMICDKDAVIYRNFETQILQLPIFGFQVIFTEDENETGKFGLQVEHIHRFWDFSLAKNTKDDLWNGYARRYINAYVPRGVDGQIKTFDEIASVDEGIDALMTLKGDVDNLGTIFQKGINPPNIAKMAALSRQMNQFFSLWLPAYCAENSPNMYTVFAGGDDFFLIGAWHSTQKVAFAMQQAFKRYVAENPEIHFSVGMVMSKVGLPVPRLGDLAEEALEKAKGIDSGKNAVTIFNRTVKWADWQQLCDLETEIHRLAKNYDISTSYLYSLIRLCEQANDKNNIESTMWRSRFYYRTARYVIDKLKQEQRDKALNEITISLGENGIGKYKINFAIPLTNYFYQKR